MTTQNAIHCSLTEPIYAAVQKHTGITADRIRSSEKIEETTHARYIFIALLKEKGIENTARIGREISKHHSSVANALQSHADLLETNAAYRKMYLSTLNEIQV
jgi:chromosomal replication initiation ATPase DnaA